jgi:hypothetical protein
MQEIPPPQVLRADRVSRDDREDMTTEDHRSQAQLLATALEESCAYAQLLWNDLNAARQYLEDTLPPDPRSPGGSLAVSASPTGPDDEPGWQSWIDAYAEITSVLCGPHGDSGFGLGEARRMAHLRRTAPITKIKAEHPAVLASGATTNSAPTAPGSGQPAPVNPGVHATAAPTQLSFTSGLATGVTLAVITLTWPRRRRPRRETPPTGQR